MKQRTKMLKVVKQHLSKMGFYQVSYDNGFKPSGVIITEDMDRGYFETVLNADESRIKVIFQLIDIKPLVITL